MQSKWGGNILRLFPADLLSFNKAKLMRSDFGMIWTPFQTEIKKIEGSVVKIVWFEFIQMPKLVKVI